MALTPSEVAQEVYDSPEDFPLMRMNTGVGDFAFFKQVAAVHWVSVNEETP